MPKAPQPPKSKKLPRERPDDPIALGVQIMREATGQSDGRKPTGPSGRPRQRKRAENMTGQKTKPAGATYHGFVDDTDPRYQSGYNFLSGKNLNPQSATPSTTKPNRGPIKAP
jgi:hypothetical protein